QSEDRAAAADESRRQAAVLPWHSVVLVTHAGIECEISPDLPVILRKEDEFILMEIPDALRRALLVVEGIQLRGRVHVDELRASAQRSRQETHHVSHALVIARRIRAGQARHLGRADRCLRYWVQD